MEKKFCRGCGKKKTLNDFYKKNQTDPKLNRCGKGVVSRCIPCCAVVARKKYLKNKTSILKKNSIWKKANPEKVYACIVRWKKTPKGKAWWKAYYAKNKYKMLRYSKKWRKSNPDKDAKNHARYWIRRYMREAAKKEIGQALGIDFSAILK
jgi:hypothetical protein